MRVEYHDKEIHVFNAEGKHVLTFHDWGPEFYFSGEDHSWSASTADGRYQLHQTEDYAEIWVDFTGTANEELNYEWEENNPIDWISTIDLLSYACHLIERCPPSDAIPVVVPPLQEENV